MAVAPGASTLTVRTDLGLAQRFARKLAAEQQMQTQRVLLGVVASAVHGQHSNVMNPKSVLP